MKEANKNCVGQHKNFPKFYKPLIKR